jgi:hypothetical protein
MADDRESSEQTPPGYRRAGPAIDISLLASAPGSREPAVSIRVNVACEEANPFRFQLEALASQDRLEVREADVTPELSESLHLRLDQWIERRRRCACRWCD